MQTDDNGGSVYLPAQKVRARYGGISDMSLWRWLNDPSTGFPQPMRINGRRFWSVADLETWERERALAEGRAA